ncbi:MAG: DUF2971 domain-containing protein [Planctomycetota bacterium]|jgi:hypothetical protein
MALREGHEELKRLYKYRPDNGHTLRVLECQELWFPFAEDFNDPFDCRVLIDSEGEGDEDDWRKLAESIPMSTETKRGAMEYLKSINFDPKTIKEQSDKHDRKTYIVYCLSEIRDNILMWSHYTNSHHGICIGFETSIQNNSLCIRHNDSDLKCHPEPAYHNFLPIYKVDYKDQYPQPYDMFKGKTADLIAFLTTKAKDWNYEQEHRIILARGDIKKNTIKFDKSILKEVIVGSKLNESFTEQVFNIIKKDYLAEGHSVEVFESSLDNQRYKLNIKKIN